MAVEVAPFTITSLSVLFNPSVILYLFPAYVKAVRGLAYKRKITSVSVIYLCSLVGPANVNPSVMHLRLDKTSWHYLVVVSI